MAIVFKDAKVFYAGYEISGDLNQVALSYAAQALESTAFGSSSRTMVGGLKTSQVSGRGFYRSGANQVDPVLFDNVGFDDGLASLFPEQITEGATSTGSGYMVRVTQSNFRTGAAVGDLMPFEFTLVGRDVR